MTDMQGMLFPPLDDEDSRANNAGDSQDQVLPREIRDRFSQVRSLLREKAAADDEESAAELKRKQEQAALETARAVREEVARLQNGIAELEAIFAMQQRQRELQLLQDDEGEDLESDSEEEEEEDEDEQVGEPANNNAANGIVFPALPSMVNAVEPETESDAGSNVSVSETRERATDEEVVATKDILCDA